MPFLARSLADICELTNKEREVATYFARLLKSGTDPTPFLRKFLPECDPPKKFSETWDLLYRSFYKYLRSGNVGGSADFVLKAGYHIEGCVIVLGMRVDRRLFLKLRKRTLGSCTRMLEDSQVITRKTAAALQEYNRVAIIPTKHPDASLEYRIKQAIDGCSATYSHEAKGLILLWTRKLSVTLSQLLIKHGVVPVLNWPLLPTGASFEY